MFKRLIASLICLTFSFSNLQYVRAQAGPARGGDFSVNQLPVPGTMVEQSAPFAPLALKGLVVNLQKPLEFQFIVDTGSASLSKGMSSPNALIGDPQQEQLKQQANQLVKYFLAGLTIPEGDLWVNLSPYEKDRMIPTVLGQTDLGRDLLAQDYILKQLTASLIYPEKDLGKDFWSRVYAKAQQQFGTTNVPVNTFNKVWILPDQAQVFENRNAAYVTKSTLKVMLDEDYLALQKNNSNHSLPLVGRVREGGINTLGSQIVRAIILPEIEKEVNTGKNFAPLRQIYQALILAKWYKETIQNGLLDVVYTNKKKVAGVNLDDPTVKEQIYERYLKAYKKGAFNYIKEEPFPPLDGEGKGGVTIPRKYFSGGIPMKINLKRDGAMSAVKSDGAMISLTVALAAGALLKPDMKDAIDKTVKLFLYSMMLTLNSPSGNHYPYLNNRLSALWVLAVSLTGNDPVKTTVVYKDFLDRMGFESLAEENGFMEPNLLPSDRDRRKLNKVKETALKATMLTGLKSVSVDEVFKLIHRDKDGFSIDSSAEISAVMPETNPYGKKDFPTEMRQELARKLLASGLDSETGLKVFDYLRTLESKDSDFDSLIGRDIREGWEITFLLAMATMHRMRTGSVMLQPQGQQTQDAAMLGKIAKIKYWQMSHNLDAIATMLGDENKNVRQAAERALTALGVPQERMIDAYRGALQLGEADARINVAKRLGELGGERAIATLLEMLKDGNTNVSYTAAKVLFDSGNRNREVLLRLYVRKKLESLQLAGAKDSLLSLLENEAYQHALDGYDFHVKFELERDGRIKLETLHIERGEKLPDQAMSPQPQEKQGPPDAAMRGEHLNLSDEQFREEIIRPLGEYSRFIIHGESMILYELKKQRPDEVWVGGYRQGWSKMDRAHAINSGLALQNPKLYEFTSIANRYNVVWILTEDSAMSQSQKQAPDAAIRSNKYSDRVTVNGVEITVFYSKTRGSYYVEFPQRFDESSITDVNVGRNPDRAKEVFNKAQEFAQADSNVDQVWEKTRDYVNLHRQRIFDRAMSQPQEKQRPDAAMKAEGFKKGLIRTIGKLLGIKVYFVNQENRKHFEPKFNQPGKKLIIALAIRNLNQLVELKNEDGRYYNFKDLQNQLEFGIHNFEDIRIEINETGLTVYYMGRDVEVKVWTEDSAMGAIKREASPGGIDLNQINVLRNGKTVNVQFDPAQLNELMQGGFEGFAPVIINMTPISSPFQLLGINPAKQAVPAKRLRVYFSLEL